MNQCFFHLPPNLHEILSSKVSYVKVVHKFNEFALFFLLSKYSIENNSMSKSKYKVVWEKGRSWLAPVKKGIYHARCLARDCIPSISGIVRKLKSHEIQDKATANLHSKPSQQIFKQSLVTSKNQNLTVNKKNISFRESDLVRKTEIIQVLSTVEKN